MFQGMKEVKDWLTDGCNHSRSSTLVLILVCYSMKQGWLLDTNRIKAYTLKELTTELCEVSTLQGKPKVILIEEYGNGEVLPLASEG